MLGKRAAAEVTKGGRIAIIAQRTGTDEAFVRAAAKEAEAAGLTVAAQAQGEPADALDALRSATADGKPLDLIIASEVAGTWSGVIKFAERQQPLLQILKRGIRFFREIFFVNHARRVTDF